LSLYIFDLDGTLYRGLEVIPEARAVVLELASRGHFIGYLTNYSGMTPTALARKLVEMGYPAEPGSVLNSGLGTARYLLANGVRSAFVVGEPDLFDTLVQNGITAVNTAESPLEWMGTEAVIVGICRSATYAWIDSAMQAIRAGARFIACNPDPIYPIEGGRVQPGAGMLVAAIARCSEQSPTIIGKPEPALIHQMMESLEVPAEQVIVVGDRDDTDMEAARRAGVRGHLIRTPTDYQTLVGE